MSNQEKIKIIQRNNHISEHEKRRLINLILDSKVKEDPDIHNMYKDFQEEDRVTKHTYFSDNS